MKRVAPSLRAMYFFQIFIALVAFAVSLLCVLFLSRFRLAMYTIVGVACSVAFVFDLMLLPLYFSRTLYTFDKQGISKKGGLFYTKRQLMKFSSVQYYTVIKTPLSEFTHLNFVVIHALGGQISLNYLSEKELLEIDRMLSQYLKRNEV